MGRLGWIAAFVYVAGAALRLARFNTTLEVADKRWFTGIPSPAAAVAVLADNEEREAGTHRVTWNPSAGGGLGSGVYFYRIEAKSVTGRAFAKTRKMLFLK